MCIYLYLYARARAHTHTHTYGTDTKVGARQQAWRGAARGAGDEGGEDQAGNAKETMPGAWGRESAPLGVMISHGMSEQDVWQGHQALVPDAGGAVRRREAGGAVGVRRADNALKARYCPRNVFVCVCVCACVCE